MGSSRIRPRSSGLRRVVTLSGVMILVMTIAVAVAQSADAFVIGGKRWPGGVIRYYNAFPADAGVVAAAVLAWNTSGAHVHFVAVSRHAARVVIQHGRGGELGANEPGRADLGWHPQASAHHPVVSINPVTGKILVTTKPQPEHVWLARVNPQHGLTSALMTVAAVHELGHILGLGHSHVCATMDADVVQRCKSPHPWQLVCRPLQPDDIRGAIALYGGRPGPLGPQRYCDKAPPPSPPIGFTGTYSPDDGTVHLSWTMPTGTTIAGSPVIAGYKVFMSSTCSTVPSTQIDQSNAAPGQHVAIAETPSGPGSWCVTVAVVDDWLRLSTPQQTTFVVPQQQ
jgi:hypothetical protein